MTGRQRRESGGSDVGRRQLLEDPNCGIYPDEQSKIG